MKKLSGKALASFIIKQIPNLAVGEKLAGKILPLDEKDMNEFAEELRIIQNQTVFSPEIKISKDIITEIYQTDREPDHNMASSIIFPKTNLIYIFDLLNNRSIYVSYEIHQFLGFDGEQLTKMEPNWFQNILHPDDDDKLKLHYQKNNFQSDPKQPEIDYRIRDVSGIWHWLRNRDVVLACDNNGEATHLLGILEDVTSQKVAEIALVESQELYADLVANQSAGIYRMLVKKHLGEISILESTLIEFVSDRFCELPEVDKQEFLKDTIASIFKRIHPADLNDFIKSNEVAQQSLEPYIWEGRLLIGNNIKWLRFESSPRELEDGSIRWTGIAVDITEQKLAGEALKISEERQRFMLESLPLAVYSSPVNPECDALWISGSVKEITGFEKDEYIAENDFWRKRLHPEDKEKVLNSFINFPLNGEMILEYRWLCKDGQYHWFIDRSVLLENGPQKEFLGVIVDITDRKQSEEAIRTEEERYRMLLEMATDAFFHGDKNGNFLTVNSVAIEQTGFSREELLKMNMKELFSEDTLEDKPLKYDLLMKGEVVISERELIRKDRKPIIVEMNSRMMPDGTFQSFFRDITERKIIEKALKQKLSELEIYYQLAITRERKMIALKSEINLLLERLGEKPKY